MNNDDEGMNRIFNKMDEFETEELEILQQIIWAVLLNRRVEKDES